MINLHRILKNMAGIVLVTGLMGCAATQKQESTGQYIDDAVITTKVKAAIFDEPTLKSMQITVETFKGIVQLSGFVDSSQNVTQAGDVAKKVMGVIGVKNNLAVK